MSTLEAFVLGVMVSWTPSLIVLAWLLRPVLKSEGSLESRLDCPN